MAQITSLMPAGNNYQNANLDLKEFISFGNEEKNFCRGFFGF
jgi:hypothetical protein